MIERWGRRRFLSGITMTILIAVLCVLPPALAVSESLRDPASERWSGGAYTYVFETYGSSLLVSVQLAILVVSLSLLIGVPAAYAFARHPFPGARALEALAMAPLALPGVAVAIGVMVGFSLWRQHLLLLAAAQMLYTVPYVVRILTNALRTEELEELHAAARTLGATAPRRFLRVTLPLLKHPLVLASLIVFAISWGEFNVAFLLAAPTQSAFPAALYATYTSNSGPVSGAATAIFLAGALPFLIALQFVEGRTVERGVGV
jgi:putative spermidine/putrescine transport system permease protein